MKGINMEQFTMQEIRSGKGFASNSLREDEALEKLSAEETILNIAYTDYGGTFYDKVLIAFFEEYQKEKEANLTIIVEETSWNGKNAIVFGMDVLRFIREIENYPVGFEYLEEFYFEKEIEAEREFVDWLIEEELKGYTFDEDEVLGWWIDKKSGYYPITTQGVDCCVSYLIQEMINDGVLKIEKED